MNVPQKSIRQKPIGLWKIIDLLSDEGGNSDVFLAQRGDDPVVALKVLTSKKPRDESYRRFQEEVALLLRLGNRPGILPQLDNGFDPPDLWLAMPVAITVREALGPDAPLEAVVAAVAAFADTLAGLASEAIYHRDIKPSNLYQLNGKWVVGDFGLASFPGKSEITTNKRQVGARNFTADEMIRDPVNADPGPADVFSLAKTLWVLATGQTWPPQGHQRIDTPSATLRDYVEEHPRRHRIDTLIERSTHPDPQQRPTMREFLMELRTWLAPPTVPAALEDISDFGERLQTAFAPQLHTQQMAQQEHQQQQKILRQLTRELAPIVTAINAVLPLSKGNTANSNNTIHNACRHTKRGNIKRTWEQCPMFMLRSPDYSYITLHSGFGIEIFEDGYVRLTAAHICEIPTRNADFNTPTDPDRIVWAASSLVPLNSEQEARAVDVLSKGLQQNLRALLERFQVGITTAAAEKSK